MREFEYRCGYLKNSLESINRRGVSAYQVLNGLNTDENAVSV